MQWATVRKKKVGRREERGVRGHYAVGYRQGKESREKGGGKRGECVDGALERAQRRGESWVCGAFRLSRL